MILTTIATLSQSQQSARLTGSKIKQTNSVSISAHLCGDRKGKMSVACRCDCERLQPGVQCAPVRRGGELMSIIISVTRQVTCCSHTLHSSVWASNVDVDDSELHIDVDVDDARTGSNLVWRQQGQSFYKGAFAVRHQDSVKRSELLITR